MSSISGVSASNSSSVSSSYASMMPRRPRPDAAKMAEDIFSKLDTKGQGYIEKSDLQSALSALSGTDSTSSPAAASADDLFSQLDGDSDGKVTKQELADSMQGLADALDSQAMSARMQMGGMPPPPPGGQGGPGGPGGGDAGLTKDELTTMASDVAATDSQRASFMNDVASNFEEADTDGDGKVSFREAMAYEQSSQTSASTTTVTEDAEGSGSSSSTVNAQESQARMMQQLMQLIHAYGDNGTSAQTSSISAIA